MILFGSRSRTINGQVIEGVDCPHCENNQFATFGVMNYFHVYWIPTFVTSRKAGIECTNCKMAMVDDDLPPELAKQIKASVFNKNNTLPMFAGAMIIAFLILVAVVGGQISRYRDSRNLAIYIEQPAIDDFYVTDFTKLFESADAEYKYGVMRVKKITSTQIELQLSKVAYNLPSGARDDINARKANIDDYFYKERMTVDIGALKEMKKAGAICSIERIFH